MPPCVRRGWRVAHRSTDSSPNEYPSAGAVIVPFMTCAPLCASGFETTDGRYMSIVLKPTRK